jgi:hypothetical protein
MNWKLLAKKQLFLHKTMENTVISGSKPTVVAPFSGNELRQWTPEELISFEDGITGGFNASKIKEPTCKLLE